MVYSMDAAWCIALREMRLGSTYPKAVEIICRTNTEPRASQQSACPLLLLPNTQLTSGRVEQHLPARPLRAGQLVKCLAVQKGSRAAQSAGSTVTAHRHKYQGSHGAGIHDDARMPHGHDRCYDEGFIPHLSHNNLHTSTVAFAFQCKQLGCRAQTPPVFRRKGTLCRSETEHQGRRTITKLFTNAGSRPMSPGASSAPRLPTAACRTGTRRLVTPIQIIAQQGRLQHAQYSNTAPTAEAQERSTATAAT